MKKRDEGLRKRLEKATEISYYKLLLNIEIDKYNDRVNEEEKIDIFQAMNSLNHHNDIEELKALIEEIKNA